MKADGDSVPAFLGWFLVGAALALAVLSLLTIGPFVMLAALGFTALLLWRVDFGWAMAGMISGAALPLLFVGWSNRHGPGEVCTRTATEISCSDQWSPWPWFVAAAGLLVGGVSLFVARRGR